MRFVLSEEWLKSKILLDASLTKLQLNNFPSVYLILSEPSLKHVNDKLIGEKYDKHKFVDF